MLNNPYGKVVIVTGASSGIGKCCAETLAGLGFTVYGCSRRGGVSQSIGDGLIKSLKLDVTDDASVKAAVGTVFDCEGGVDILVNCAGIGIAGAVEDCTGADALRQLDTNYVGMLRMIGAVLPSMRARKNGLIINIGSVGGIYSVPFQTLYSSSKAAVDAMTEGLRIELKPWGVKAVTIEPGDVKTGFTAARVYAEGCPDGRSDYGVEFARAIKQMEKDEQGGKGPDTVVREIIRMIKRKNPPVRCVVGFQYKLFVFLKRIFPKCLVESILTSMYPNSHVPLS